ncbi:uncharacterized protein [Panulirus ornatus]
MVLLAEEAVALRQDISLALRTTVRESLALLCDKLFTANNPGKTPYKVLCRNTQTCNFLRNNPFQGVSIKKNKIEKLDVTCLRLLLRYACGLSSNKCAWKDLTRLEGNIDKLRQLRNDDAHATHEECSMEELEDKWQQLVMAVTNVLQMGGLEDQLARVKQELINIRKPKLETVADGKVIGESIQRELQELYSCGRKTTLMPFLWAGKNFDFNHHVEKVYTKTRLSTTQDGMLRDLDGESMLEDLGSSRMIILQGESGTGKTSLLRHYAAAWGGNTSSTLPALSNVDYLIFLDITAVATRAFTIKDIILEILPNTCCRWKPGKILKELSRAGSKVMFLIDAFDERLDAFVGAFKTLQGRCSDAVFVVTTRPHCTLAITKLCDVKPTVVTTHGFSRSSAVDYATRLFKTCGKTFDVEKFFSAVSSYDELITIPQLLCWSSWLWMEEGSDHFSTRGKVFASITDFLLRKLCHINGKRVLSGELPSEGHRWLSAVARLAFKQAKHNRTLLTESSPEIKELLELARQLKLMPYEALSTLLQCDSNMTGHGEHIVFQFVHDSHADFLAAFHIVKTFQSSKNSVTNLLKDLQVDKKKSIISFIVSLVFEKMKAVAFWMIQDFPEMCKPYSKFYDINFLLDLIEESDYNAKLGKELAKQIAGNSLRTLSPSPAAGSRTDSSPQFRGQLWLRPKELRRSRALSMLLSHAKPARLWLRLSEGPRADDESSARGHQVVEGDPVAAMRLVSTAYGHSVLPELRLTDLTVMTPLTWPEGLWWLSLERCDIKSDLGLPPALLKLSLVDCTELTNVKFPLGLKSLKLEGMCLEDPWLPGKVETLVLTDCTFQDLTFLPPSIKYLKLDGCSIGGNLIIPRSLEHLTVNMCNIIKSEFVRKQDMYTSASRAFILLIRQIVRALRNLKSLYLRGIALSPEDFIDLLLEFQDHHPGGRLVVNSVHQLQEECIERDIIVASVVTSSLPEVTVTFENERITNSQLNRCSGYRADVGT